LIQCVGVCRDYAHLAIALCRALCIPARYISGYAVALQPPDFHGFFETYLRSRWYLFDATRMSPIEGFVRIGTGRDAADASFATIIGSATLTHMVVWAEQRVPNLISNQPVSGVAASTTN
jgi:transglutaminase-like putative cysteine protease